MTTSCQSKHWAAQIFDAQGDMDKKWTELVEDIENQLQTSTERETLFTIRWELR